MRNKKLKRFTWVFWVAQFLLSPALYAQVLIDTTGIRGTVQREAETFILSGYKGDFNTAIKYYHPEEVESAGGGKKLMNDLKEGFRAKLRLGLPPMSFASTLPQELLIDDTSIQCVFNYSLTPRKEYATEFTAYKSILIAVFDLTKKQWYFIDAKDSPIDKLSMYFSFINPNLSLPMDPALVQQVKGLNWEFEPFITAKKIESFNRRKQRVIFSIPEALLSTRLGLVTTRGKILLKPVYLGIEDRDSILLVNSEDDIFGSMIREGKWQEFHAQPKDLEDIISINNRQKQSQLSGLRYTMIQKGDYRIETLSKQFIMRLKADQAPIFSKKYITFKKDNKCGVLNHQGKTLIPAQQFESISHFNSVGSSTALLASNQKKVLIDTLGNIIYNADSTEILDIYGDSMPFFAINKTVNGESKYGIIDRWGKIIIEPSAESFINFNEKVYASHKGEKWCINSVKDHHTLLDGRSFNTVNISKDYFVTADHTKQLIEVYTNDGQRKLGLNVDAYQGTIELFNGKEILIVNTPNGKIPYLLDGSLFIKNASIEESIPLGLIIAREQKMGLVDFSGKELIPTILDDLEYLQESQSLWGKINGKWGLIKQ